MPATLHHATRKRAASAGCTILDAPDGGFLLVLDKTGQTSVGTWDDAKEAANAAVLGSVTWAKTVRSHCGVMPMPHHDRYEHNPHGPGCNDGLDCALRDAFTQGGEDLNVVALQKLGEDLGLWNEAWDVRNPGMKRMNLANRIRGWLRNDADAKLALGDKVGRFGVPYQPATRRRRAQKAA